jgi:hypothetical protein
MSQKEEVGTMERVSALIEDQELTKEELMTMLRQIMEYLDWRTSPRPRSPGWQW